MEKTLIVSAPAPPLTVVAPRGDRYSTMSAPLPLCTFVVPVCVLAMVKRLLPWPRAMLTAAMPL